MMFPRSEGPSYPVRVGRSSGGRVRGRFCIDDRACVCSPLSGRVDGDCVVGVGIEDAGMQFTISWVNLLLLLTFFARLLLYFLFFADYFMYSVFSF